MTPKTYYLAIQIKENDKYAAYVQPVGECVNVASVLANIKNLASANIVNTRKRAEEITEEWNRCFRANNSYAFS